MVLENLFDSAFGSFVSSAPLTFLLVTSFVISLIVTVAYKYFTNQEMMKALKEDITRIQKELKNSKDNQARMMELNKEVLDKNMKYMMHGFIPSLITLVPLLIIFGWLRNAYKDTSLNFLGFIDSWLWVYILVSIVASILIRKMLKVY